MSEKKMSEGRRKWKMNAIALLKPLVVEGNHISRRIAVKLVKPTNDWERRQLDTLRGQANKIIRRENTDPLLYTVWGMSLEHPNMAMAKKIAAVMPQGNAYESPFVMPERLDIRGMQDNAEAVYRNDRARPGDVWVIRVYNSNEHLLMFIEEGNTYVLTDPVGPDALPAVSQGERFSDAHVGLARIDIINLKAGDKEKASTPTIAINLMLKEEALALANPKDGDAYADDGQLHIYSGEKGKWSDLDITGLRNTTNVRAMMPKSDFLSACGVTPMVRGKVATTDNLPETGEQGDLYYVEELNFEPVGHNGTDWVSTYPPFEVVKKCLPIAKGARRVFGGQTEFWDGKQWVLSLDEHETHQVAVMDPARQEKQSVWQRLKRIAGFK